MWQWQWQWQWLGLLLCFKELGMDKRAGEVAVETEIGACKHMVVLGATSDIAVVTLKEFAKRGQWHFSCAGVMRRRCGD